MDVTWVVLGLLSLGAFIFILVSLAAVADGRELYDDEW